MKKSKIGEKNNEFTVSRQRLYCDRQKIKPSALIEETKDVG